jgi:hypothetical protein
MGSKYASHSSLSNLYNNGNQESIFKEDKDRMRPDPIQLGILALLFVLFLNVVSISNLLGHSLDTLPMRIAAMLIILASVTYDKFVAIGVFMVVCGIFVQHHQNDLANLATPGRDTTTTMNPYQIPKAKVNVREGGQSDLHYEESDYTPHKEDQTDEFVTVGHSQDEKQVLVNETLGSRSQSIFSEDMRNAEAMAMRNRDGAD